MTEKVIQFFRKNSGLTQEQMACKLNVDRSLISKYEKGLVEPSLGTLREMSKIFNIPFSLLGLCLDLTNYSLGQAKAIVLSKDPESKPYFLDHGLYLEQHFPLPTSISSLSDYEKNMIIQFLEEFHGHRISSSC